jgi:hypothetical protein
LTISSLSCNSTILADVLLASFASDAFFTLWTIGGSYKSFHQNKCY